MGLFFNYKKYAEALPIVLPNIDPDDYRRLSKNQILGAIELYLRNNIKIVHDCAEIVNKTENIETFLNRYDLLLKVLYNITIVAKCPVNYLSSDPQKDYDRIIERRSATEKSALNRYINKEKTAIEALSTEKRKAQKLRDLYENLTMLVSNFTPENQEYIKSMESEISEAVISAILKNFDLDTWFYSTFDKDEIEIILETCPYFTEDVTAFSFNSAALLLAHCIQCFTNEPNYSICRKFANKIDDILSIKKPKSESLHLIYMFLISFFYKYREQDDCLDKAVECCNKQIAIAKRVKKALGDVEHHGYKQLAIIEKKQHNWSRVIELCNQAKQEGWAGDWDNRISEAEKALAKK